MAKNKQQKKKERERRVAQKKHAAAMKRQQEQATKEGETAAPKTKRVFTPQTLPKTQHVATTQKSNFMQRRIGG